jgi:hypothetical protein
MQSTPGAHATNVASVVGASENTIRTALAWQPGNPMPQIGAPRLLQEHHKIYIKARTISNQTMMNADLAQERAAFFPDLQKGSEQTVRRCRHPLGLLFRPPRSACEMTEGLDSDE